MSLIPISKSGSSASAVARTVALKAGDVLMERFGSALDISFKGRGDLVTDVDKAVELEMRSLLANEYPDIEFLGEESANVAIGDGYLWIVDPLDGTRNYASGIPHFSTVVALVLNGKPLVGVNYDPVRQDLFEAELDKGALYNGQSMEVSSRTNLKDSVIGMDMSYDNEGAINGLDVIRSIWPGMQTVRVMGSAALGLSYAAAGITDLYFHHQLAPWDQVAGLLMIKEAGGVVTDRSNKPAGLNSDGIIASNSTLHSEFLQKTENLAWSSARTP